MTIEPIPAINRCIRGIPSVLSVLFLLFVLFVLSPFAAAAQPCPGDCNDDSTVTINELITAVTIALARAPVGNCAAADRDADGAVIVSELINAVRSTLDGCPVVLTPTASPLPTPTATPRCDLPGVICTIAGTGNAQFDGDGRPARETSLYFPLQVLFDRDGQPLILDWNNLRLRRIELDGTVRTIMGTGDEALPIEGGPAVDTPLHHASDVRFDADGRMYLAGDHVSIVFRVDTDQRVFTIAGNCPTQPDDCFGYDGDGGPALEARLGTPVGVLPDEVGGFYISDVWTDSIRYVDAAGIIHHVAGGKRCAVTTSQRCVVSTDCPELEDGGHEPCREGYAGDGQPAAEAEIADPRRITFGPDGGLYFAESRNHVIRRIRTDGTIETFAGTGVAGYTGDGGPAREAQLNGPYDVVFAPDGDAYVADTNNNVIRRIDADGTITTVVGTGEAGFAGDLGPAAAARLRRPSGLVFDEDGSLWIADTSNHRVRRVWRFLSPAS